MQGFSPRQGMSGMTCKLFHRSKTMFAFAPPNQGMPGFGPPGSPPDQECQDLVLQDDRQDQECQDLVLRDDRQDQECQDLVRRDDRQDQECQDSITPGQQGGQQVLISTAKHRTRLSEYSVVCSRSRRNSRLSLSLHVRLVVKKTRFLVFPSLRRTNFCCRLQMA